MSDQGMTYEDFMRSLAQTQKEMAEEEPVEDTRDLILSGCSLNWNRRLERLRESSEKE